MYSINVLNIFISLSYKNKTRKLKKSKKSSTDTRKLKILVNEPFFLLEQPTDAYAITLFSSRAHTQQQEKKKAQF
jgi:hypothetical protein